MLDLRTVPTPALVLDLDVVERNLERMAAKCDALDVTLRPHFKTHKCAGIAELQVGRSNGGGTVATLEEARYFLDRGFDDLVWALPLVPGRITEALDLAERGLELLVDSRVAVDALVAAGRPCTVRIKVDCGYHRAGVDPDGELLLEIASLIETTSTLRPGGLLTHAGHSYAARTPRAVRDVADEERRVMLRAAERLAAAGLDHPRLSLGSTPGMCAVQHLDGIDEVRPGNYALFDYTQVLLGSCRVADCAATVLTTVISNAHGGAVVDAGALALSCDPGPAHRSMPGFGEIFVDYPSASLDRELRVRSLSQEHGKLSGPAPVGTRLRVLPNHSCLTVAQFDAFTVVRGESVVDRWPIHRLRSPAQQGRRRPNGDA